jgi:hypothetical protein
MGRIDPRIAAVLAAAVLVCVAGGAQRPVDVDGVQAAVRAFRDGRYELAEQIALELANRPGEPVPRAWLVVAAARQQRERHASAARAYRLFLGSCDSPRLREYARRRLRTCEAGPADEPAAGTPSDELSPQELERLRRVSDRVYAESSEHFVVRARNPELARLLIRRAEAALRRICGVLLGGQAYPHSVDVYVWADRDEYRLHAVDAPDYSGGNFTIRHTPEGVVRRIDLTQLDADGRFDVLMLDRVLPHELCHLVTHEYFGDAHCPLFLDEGLAMLAEAETDNARVLLAGSACAAERGLPLGRLFLCDRRAVDDVAVFYAESFSFVEYVHRRLTREQFRRFLEQVKGGCTVAEALQRALHLPPDESFLPALADAWESHAIAQAQYLRALRGQPGLLDGTPR